MVIKNSTCWRTDQLRNLFRRCVKEVDKVEKPNTPFHKRNKHFKLDILNSSRSNPSGRAAIKGYWAMIKIPNHCRDKKECPTKPIEIRENGDYCYGNEYSKVCFSSLAEEKPEERIKKYPAYWAVVGNLKEMRREDKIDLAKVMIHEYYHTIGYRNQDYHNYKYDWTKKWEVEEWIDQYPIEVKEVVKKPAVDIKLIRYQRAIQNLRTAETRFKRAKTLYKKWSIKVKRYETVCGFKQN